MTDDTPEVAFADYAYALKFRNVVQQIVNTEIDKIRPRYQYATVTAIDRFNRKCTIQFPGDASTVKVNMGSTQPGSVGQVVRVSGVMGDRYIDEVLGPANGEQPVGSYLMHSVATAPPGYLPCEHGSYLIANYPALSAEIRSTFGGADATHFYTPDASNRSPIGGAANVGSTGGNAQHSHVGADHAHNVPAHNHEGVNHSHTLSDAGQAVISLAAASPSIYVRRVDMTSTAATHSIATTTAASSSAAQLQGAALRGSTDAGGYEWTDGRTNTDAALSSGLSDRGLTTALNAATYSPWFGVNVMIKT